MVAQGNKEHAHPLLIRRHNTAHLGQEGGSRCLCWVWGAGLATTTLHGWFQQLCVAPSLPGWLSIRLHCAHVVSEQSGNVCGAVCTIWRVIRCVLVQLLSHFLSPSYVPFSSLLLPSFHPLPLFPPSLPPPSLPPSSLLPPFLLPPSSLSLSSHLCSGGCKLPISHSHLYRLLPSLSSLLLLSPPLPSLLLPPTVQRGYWAPSNLYQWLPDNSPPPTTEQSHRKIREFLPSNFTRIFSILTVFPGSQTIHWGSGNETSHILCPHTSNVKSWLVAFIWLTEAD